MNRQLFRQEAIDAQREKLLGAVSNTRPVPMRVFALIAASFAIALIVFAFWGEYTRRERVEGFLATDVGAARVQAPLTAVVEELYVKEGAEVEKGARIVKLTMSSVGTVPKAELEAQITEVDAEIAAAKQVARQEEDAARARIASSDSELQVSAGEIDLQTARVATAQQELDRAQRLRKEGFYSEAEVTKRGNDLLEQRTKLQATRRQRAGLERDLANARSALAAVSLKLNEKLAQLQRKRSEVVSALEQDAGRRATEIVAPTSGVVTNIAVARGDSVAADAPIAMVVPKGSLRAELLVPTRASGFIRPGNSVVLRYDAFPFQRFGQYRGKVDDVSRTVWSPGERVGPMVAREPVYRVDVKLDRQTVTASGQEMPLRPGMTVSADILLEKRTVFEWIFEPVLELRGRLE
jgi:membrane fusion protein